MSVAKRLYITILLLFCSCLPVLAGGQNFTMAVHGGCNCISVTCHVVPEAGVVGEVKVPADYPQVNSSLGDSLVNKGELPGWSLLCKHDMLPAGVESSVSAPGSAARVLLRTYSGIAHYVRLSPRGIGDDALSRLTGSLQEGNHSLALPCCAADYFVYTLLVIRC